MTEQLSCLKSRFILAVLGCTLSWCIGCWKHTPASPPSNKLQPETMPASEITPATTHNYVRLLTEAGWDQEAAAAVVELNDEWFSIMAENNPNGLERQLKLLAALGKHEAVHGFIREHPETAGLLAGSDHPEQLAASLEISADKYPVLAALYMQHSSPEDAGELAKALQRNRDLIFELQQRGLIGCEVLFMFDRQHPSVEVYETWLREVISSKLQASDEELASLVNLVMHHGPWIRQRLRDDEMFRSHFHTTLWPCFQRATNSENGLFELYLDEPRVWNWPQRWHSCGSRLQQAPLTVEVYHACSMTSFVVLPRWPSTCPLRKLTILPQNFLARRAVDAELEKAGRILERPITNGVHYRAVLATQADQSVSSESLKRAEAWLEGYYRDAGYFRWLSHLFLSRSQAFNLMADLRIRREVMLWKAATDAGEPQIRVLIAQEYLQHYRRLI